MTTPEDPNNIADALVADGNDPGWVKAALMTFASAGCEVVPAGTFAAAGLEIARVGTADRLAAAQAELESLDAEIDHVWIASAEKMMAQRDAAEARLAALLDAIGDPETLRLSARDGFDRRANTHLYRVADAAAAAREDQ
jgi:hypothetical protein